MEKQVSINVYGNGRRIWGRWPMTWKLDVHDAMKAIGLQEGDWAAETIWG